MNKKSEGGIITGLTIAAMVFVILFGMLGGLICFSGLYGIFAICKSKLPIAAKIFLSIVLGAVLLALMFFFVVLSAAVQME